MEAFGEVRFFGLLIFLLIPAVILGLRARNQRYYILLSSLIAITAMLQFKHIQLIYLAVYTAWQWVVIRSYLQYRLSLTKEKLAAVGRRAKQLYSLALIASLAPLLISKTAGLFSLSWFGFIGISYLTFRGLQLIIEMHDGLITELRLIDFLCFMLFFASLSSGPIDRSRRFVTEMRQTKTRSQYLDALGEGLYLLAQGMVYKFVLGDSLFLLFEKLRYIDNQWLYGLVYAYVYGLYLFFDFAGYSLMVIGTAYFFGISMPANFNKPFMATDMKDFWNRWHMTLSYWFRDYIFSRLTIRWIKKKRFSSRLQVAIAGYMVNMTVMGIWHGLSIDYIIYGVYHGILLALTEVMQKKWGWYKKHKNEQAVKLVGWLITLQLVMFGFLIFSGELRAIIRR